MKEIASFCGKCDCGCPTLFFDQNASADKQVVMTDDFGQRIQMSSDQWESLVEAAQNGKLSVG